MPGQIASCVRWSCVGLVTVVLVVACGAGDGERPSAAVTGPGGFLRHGQFVGIFQFYEQGVCVYFLFVFDGGNRATVASAFAPLVAEIRARLAGSTNPTAGRTGLDADDPATCTPAVDGAVGFNESGTAFVCVAGAGWIPFED